MTYDEMVASLLPECERCGDSGEIQVGPAPYDTDECPACTRRTVR